MRSFVSRGRVSGDATTTKSDFANRSLYDQGVIVQPKLWLTSSVSAALNNMRTRFFI